MHRGPAGLFSARQARPCCSPGPHLWEDAASVPGPPRPHAATEKPSERAQALSLRVCPAAVPRRCPGPRAPGSGEPGGPHTLDTPGRPVSLLDHQPTRSQDVQTLQAIPQRRWSCRASHRGVEVGGGSRQSRGRGWGWGVQPAAVQGPPRTTAPPRGLAGTPLLCSTHRPSARPPDGGGGEVSLQTAGQAPEEPAVPSLTDPSYRGRVAHPEEDSAFALLQKGTGKWSPQRSDRHVSSLFPSPLYSCCK